VAQIPAGQNLIAPGTALKFYEAVQEALAGPAGVLVNGEAFRAAPNYDRAVTAQA
jgi:hypothetical protein